MLKRKLTMLIALSWFTASIAFSQVTVSINANKDTMYCFSSPQAKFLLKLPFKIKEQEKTINVYEQVFEYKDSTHTADSITMAAMGRININNLDAAALAESLHRAEVSALNREIKRQKRQKWIAIGVAVLVTAAKIAADFRK